MADKRQTQMGVVAHEGLTLTPDIIRAMVTGGNYQNKIVCCTLAEELNTHYYGRMPRTLICERRPNESKEIKDYREKIYVPITKKTVTKVISSLEKIRRSQDWNIQYKAEATPARIAAEETLERYCEYDYPHFTSVTNWAFSVLLHKYLLDANGIIAVVPERLPSATTEYVRPVAEFFDSEQIVDYSEGEYVVLKSRDTSTYITPGGKKVYTNGAIYYVITENEFVRYEQIDAQHLSVKDIYRHNIGSLPAFKAGGVYFARAFNDTIYQSRIAGMVPNLNEAAREYSDLQAEILQHIHSEKYAFANADCPVCHGTGREYVKDKDGNPTDEQRVCHMCHGRGTVLNVSPYGEYIINGAKLGENQLPTPPMGYVNKSTDIARFSDEHVRQHIYDALAAVNMEFLAETPINQSGVAKAYDKDELNNFVNSIAEDIVRILDSVYRYICEYRYKVIVPNDEERHAMLPMINVPTRFDIVNMTAVMEELKGAKEAGVNPLIMRELNLDYARKQFNTNPDLSKLVEMTFDLDPLFGVTEDAKMTMLQTGGITMTDYIISCNIAAFVRRAVREDKDFYTKDFKAQYDTLKGYADEVSKANEPSAQMTLQEQMRRAMESGSESTSESGSQSESESGSVSQSSEE